MARKRMISPNIWTSQDVGKLTIFERLLLIGMFSNADDEGKGIANVMLLRSEIFPYDDVSTSDMGTALKHIQQHINIQFYTVDGSEYYKFTRWKKWQTVNRPQSSIIPEPISSGESISDESVNNHGAINANTREDNTIQDKLIETKLSNDSSACTDELVDNSLKEVIMEFEGSGYGTVGSTISEMLQGFIKDYSTEWTLMALKEGVRQGKRKLSYVEGILKNWKADGGPKFDDGSKKSVKFKAPKTAFNSYSQREYTPEKIKELENSLLGRSGLDDTG